MDLPRMKPAPSRWFLRLQAVIWRFLMEIGMLLHRLAPPRPRRYAFTRRIPTTISPTSGKVTLYFYTPLNYRIKRKIGKPGTKFPVVVNFHGGGFTLGTSTDDARWAQAVVEETGAVVVGVDYRLAPEHPFPTAVEDGADAIVYLAKHADELWLDVEQVAISGFSCGGNLALTVPLRLQEELGANLGGQPMESRVVEEGLRPASSWQDETPLGTPTPYTKHDFWDDTADAASKLLPPPNFWELSRTTSATSSTAVSTPYTMHGNSTQYTVHGNSTQESIPGSSFQYTTHANSTQDTIPRNARQFTMHENPTQYTIHGDDDSNKPGGLEIPVQIVAIISWYPSTDYTLSREARLDTLTRKDMQLSPIFTNLFDHSYLSPPELDRFNPYLSPGVAPEALLRSALPSRIILFTCEWDMLQSEGANLRDRLQSLGKTVVHRLIREVPHGWDKSANPFRVAPGVNRYYKFACKELKSVFKNGVDEFGLEGIDRGSIGPGRLSVNLGPEFRFSL